MLSIVHTFILIEVEEVLEVIDQKGFVIGDKPLLAFTQELIRH